jgi:hypothetical protein
VFLVHNERTKLTATWLNALATALVAAGTFAPLAALMYGFSAPAANQIVLGGLALVCFVAGLCLHWGGRAYLKRLRE